MGGWNSRYGGKPHGYSAVYRERTLDPPSATHPTTHNAHGICNACRCASAHMRTAIRDSRDPLCDRRELYVRYAYGRYWIKLCDIFEDVCEANTISKCVIKIPLIPVMDFIIIRVSSLLIRMVSRISLIDFQLEINVTFIHYLF